MTADNEELKHGTGPIVRVTQPSMYAKPPKAERTPSNQIEALKRDLYPRIRAHAATMDATERARFVAGLPAAEAAAFRRIVGAGKQADRQPASDPAFAAFDRSFGISQPSAAITRSAHQLTASALGAPKRATAGAPPRKPENAPPVAGALCPRSSRTGRVTAFSTAADELDRRMGIAPAAASGGVQRTRTELTFKIGAEQ